MYPVMPRVPYWSGDEIFRTPVFGQVMPRDRFLLLLRFLHFNDNDSYDAKDPERDRLQKIRPIQLQSCYIYMQNSY